jgi:hypothetical protein
MAISTGSTIVAADFVATSAGAGDSGKVPKLNAAGKLDQSMSTIVTRQVFTGHGTYTYTKPANVSWVEVEVIGGGRGGCSSQNGVAGSAGGDSSFGAYVVAKGAGSGTSNVGDIIIAGQAGKTKFGTTSTQQGGDGGNSFLGFGGAGAVMNNSGGNGNGYGAGGGGGAGGVNPYYAGNGSAGADYVKKIVTTITATVTVTIGQGSAGGINSDYQGGSGTDGIVIVTEHYL